MLILASQCDYLDLISDTGGKNFNCDFPGLLLLMVGTFVSTMLEVGVQGACPNHQYAHIKLP